MELKHVLEKAQEVVALAEEKGWSEEELAKVISLLHSELQNHSLGVSLPHFDTIE